MKINQPSGPAARSDVFLLKPEELTLIKDTAHPLYDKRVDLPLDEGMVQSILAFGVKEPIIVCKDGDGLIVIDGLQRVKNAIEANRRLGADKEPIKVKAIVEKGSDEDLYGVKILTNECRQDDPVVAKAEKVQKYMSMGRSEAQAAVVFGTSVPGIKQLLALLDLTAAARKAVSDGVLSLSAGAHLAKLSRDKQAKALEELMKKSSTKGKKKGKVTVRAVKAVSALQPPTKKEIQLAIDSGLIGEDAKAALVWVLTGKAGGSVKTAFVAMLAAPAVPQQAAPSQTEASA